MKQAAGVVAGLVSGVGLTALKWSWIPGNPNKFLVLAISLVALVGWMWATDIIGWRFSRAASRKREASRSIDTPSVDDRTDDASGG